MRTPTLATGDTACGMYRRAAGRVPGFADPRPARSETAFTLVEVLVALALLAVAAGIIVPRMSRSMERGELREAVGRFAHTAKAVRQYAMGRRQACTMEIDLDAGTYAVTVQSVGHQAAGPQVMRASWLKVGRWPPTVRVSAYQTPDGSASRNGIQRLSFFPDGTTSGASIRLAHGSDEYQVVVHPHSGQVVFGDAMTAIFAEDRYELGD